jgi:hypothetical protein
MNKKTTNISLHELHELKSKKDRIQLICYEKVLELCHKKLRLSAENGSSFVFFEIPGFLMGYPLYSLEKCREYVIEVLRKTGFLVQQLNYPKENVLYISWSPEDLGKKKKLLM